MSKSGQVPNMISVRLDNETAASLRQLAKEEERPEGQLARILIKEALAARKRKKK